MPVRRTGFGSHASPAAQAVARRMASTKALAERQPQGAVWATSGETRQWACPCGAPNPERRTKCRACGEERSRP